MTNTLEKETMIAVEAVRRAMAVCTSVRARLVTADTITKKDKSPVTVADYASQAVVCSVLSAVFPHDPVVGEEAAIDLRGDAESQAKLRDAVFEAASAEMPEGTTVSEMVDFIGRGADDGSSRRYWALDPIDGTKGFLRGEQYAVALALIVDHEVVFGVLGCPNYGGADAGSDAEDGAIFVAARGRGAHLIGNNRPVRVSDVASTSAARLCESVESAHSDQSQSRAIARKLGLTGAPLRMDSQVKYAAVADGAAEIYLRLPTRADYEEKIWDHAAGMIIVEEAGGKVTDIAGKPLDFSHGRTLKVNRGVVATNGKVHGAVLEAVVRS